MAKRGPKQQHTIVGKFFHSFPVDPKTGQRRISWQGQVLSEPQPGIYLVELYEWVTGGPSDQMVIPLQQMTSDAWQFYADHEYWNMEGSRKSRDAERVPQ